MSVARRPQQFVAEVAIAPLSPSAGKRLWITDAAVPHSLDEGVGLGRSCSHTTDPRRPAERRARYPLSGRGRCAVPAKSSMVLQSAWSTISNIRRNRYPRLDWVATGEPGRDHRGAKTSSRTDCGSGYPSGMHASLPPVSGVGVGRSPQRSRRLPLSVGAGDPSC